MAYFDAHQGEYGVEPVCGVLRDVSAPIAPSTYYAFEARPPWARSVSDAATTAVIAEVHADSYGATG